MLPGDDWLHETPPEKMMWLHLFGRLKPGATPARVEAEANAIFKRGLETFYGPSPRQSAGASCWTTTDDDEHYAYAIAL